jgi:hypothetical protein
MGKVIGTPEHFLADKDRASFKRYGLGKKFKIASITRKASTMNRIVIASEILKIAKELMAIEFDTEAEKKKYQQEHDVRPGTKLTVKKTDKKAPIYDMGSHPLNLMRKRKNEQRLQEIGKFHGKDPKDLTNKDIEEYNQRKPSDGHTHSFGKLNPTDTDETRVRIYDSGEDQIDRYTAIVEGKDWDATASPGFKPSLGFGVGGGGVSQWGDAKEGKHLGKKVKFTDLDKDSQEHLLKRLRESGT